MKIGYVVNMAKRNKCITLMGPPSGMMDGGKIWPTMQYEWSRWLMNMPIHTKGDSLVGMQIEVNSKKWPKKS